MKRIVLAVILAGLATNPWALAQQPSFEDAPAEVKAALKKNDLPGAIAAYTQELAKAYVMRGLLFSANKEFGKAAEDFATALLLVPDFPGAAALRDQALSQKEIREDPFAGAEEAAKAACQKKWPDEAKMREVCAERQLEALKLLKAQTGAGLPEKTFARLRQDCRSKWPDNFEMRLYCEREQLEAWKKQKK